ncbi:1,4-alpha-glucan branching enzyme [Halomicronema hongdechloris C2206]|uniref:1,4-alpha-glucan branching enzyme GlgB n=1 Tax=Halomicronema hongdechloris C2206 TaxID=1641165 RepID=A0A1Z3HJI6_9CYAN|nr:1,4-alpha-glucan branching protein GlgB [Halomicronema hongdechloris]ASC70445.1 1,4-alpha-glucan branching enzyme [Halomicronema hongdechloris C2206]
MVCQTPIDQIKRITENQHDNPFEILGSHVLEDQDHHKRWVVRAFLPNADAVWVINPEARRQHPMQSVHHPHFFECEVEADELAMNYLLKIKEGEHERVIHDPYAFKTPLLTDYDIYLFGEGNHHRIYEKMGAHPVEVDGVAGVYFSVWAPNARNVSIIGDFNQWDGRKHQMRRLNGGVWDLFIPELTAGTTYKYEIKNPAGHLYYKSDPYGFQQEVRPNTASVVNDLEYTWGDDDWLEARRHQDPQQEPISVYEVHLGSWLHASADQPPEPGEVVRVSQKPEGRFLTYRELAHTLVPYAKELGYTHIEVLPVAEHPYDGSWGYQVAGHYAPTSRFGTPQDFMYFVDQCHQQGLGVIVDWVPGHFPKDSHGLACFDGSHLYEHADPRKGEHKGWGTLVFNYSRREVSNFLIANALFWFDKYHIDGIRVDAVASMLYLDYDRKDGEWVPNRFGGNENLEVVDFLRQLNYLIFGYYPGVLSIAEESTAWPNVSRPTYIGGLGFNLKWNMGWMHDMLDYFSTDPLYRRYHQNHITFSIWYAFSENFMLALSHDEVVHGKGNLYQKMPGDEWQKLANLRALYGYMYTHPGKKTLFMGMEFGQTSEWNCWLDLDWGLLNQIPHQQLKQFIGDLNALYKSQPALYTDDFSAAGFEWIDCNDADNSVVSFIRQAKDSPDFLVTVCNFTPTPLFDYWVGVPEPGHYQELINSDAEIYGGSDTGNFGGKDTQPWPENPRWPHALSLTLPPLGVLVLKLS